MNSISESSTLGNQGEFNSSPSRKHWQGVLHLQFARQPDRTQLRYSHAQAPLKVQRPFYPEGEICHVVGLHTAGGVAGGDRLLYDIQLQPSTQALMTTATAAKIYRSGGLLAEQQVSLQIADHACLEWLPQETIVFNDARYYQTMRVDLGQDALWMGWEITRLGRTARGERFAQGEWRSQIEVWQAGVPLWIDLQQIEGDSSVLDSVHGLGGAPIIGSFAIVGRDVTPELVQHVRDCWNDRPYRADTLQLGEAGVTRLMAGLLCRYRGYSSTEVRHWFIAVWHCARQALCDRSACPPRVWQL